MNRHTNHFNRWLCPSNVHALLATVLLLATWSAWSINGSLASAQEIEAAGKPDEVLRKSVAPLDLVASDGTKITIAEDAPAVVICFLGTECPLARKYAPRLQRIADQWKARGVVVIGVDSNLQDTAREIEEFRQANNIRFAIAVDADQRALELLGARRTPEVVVLDRRRAIRYQGRIDDQYLPGLAKPEATVHELHDAVEAIVSDKPILVAKTEPVGCLITKSHSAAGNNPVRSTEPSTSPEQSITYTKHIAPIFRAHCVECHRSGEIGPFAMTDYDEVRGWGAMIAEVIDDGRMPPWHAAPGHARLRNARLMPDKDKRMVRDWVAAGMPRGADQDSSADNNSTEKTVWHLPRNPDLVVSMSSKPYKIPAEGVVEYQYFVVDPQLKEDRWVSAAQVIPGNPGVVHHAIVFIRPPEETDFRGVSWLTGYVPGQRHSPMPAGSARRIPAGSKLVFQMHYTPNGQPQEDNTQVGMIFANEETIENEVLTVMAINQEFEIPPNVDNHAVPASARKLPKGGQLLAISPHMHVRGKAFQLFAKRGDELETILDVPRYDFNWQHTYELDQPIALDSIDSLETICRFDNSSGNVVNPNPNTVVTWGDQTFEEMAVAFFEVSQPRSLLGQRADKRKTTSDPTDSRREEAVKFADDYLKKLDTNRDGFIAYDEAPLTIQRYAFRRFDADSNGRIEKQEVIDTYLNEKR